MTDQNYPDPNPGATSLPSLSAIDGIPMRDQADETPVAGALAEALRKVAIAAGDVPRDLRASTYCPDQDPSGAWAALIHFDHLVRQERPVDLETAGRLFDILHRLSLRHGIAHDGAHRSGLPAEICEEARQALARFDKLRPDHDSKMQVLLSAIDPARYTHRQLKAALEFTFSMLGARQRAGFRQSELDATEVATFLERAAGDLPAMDVAAARYWAQIHYPESQWREEATVATAYEDWLLSKASVPLTEPAEGLVANFPDGG